MKKLLTLILATAITTAPAFAASDTKSEESMDQANKKTSEKVVEKNRAIIAEARSAMEDTKKALESIDKENKKEAQKHLRSATGKLEMVVARKPSLGLAAFDVSVLTNALIGDADQVKKFKEQAITALKEDRVQEARSIISKLRSDTIISVSHIPIATYPEAMKEAARLIDQNKFDEAQTVITSALGTIVMTETVIPLPLARADFFIDEASKLASKENRSKEEKEMLSAYLKDGRNSLQMAEVLGYAPKDELKDLYSKLDKTKAETEDGKSGNWLQDVKEKISSFFMISDDKKKQAQEE